MKIQDCVGITKLSSPASTNRHSCSHSCHHVLELVEKNLNLFIDIIVIVVVVIVIILILPVVVVVGHIHDKLQQQHNGTQRTENR